jgi:hypothetical protein
MAASRRADAEAKRMIVARYVVSIIRASIVVVDVCIVARDCLFGGECDSGVFRDWTACQCQAQFGDEQGSRGFGLVPRCAEIEVRHHEMFMKQQQRIRAGKERLLYSSMLSRCLHESKAMPHFSRLPILRLPTAHHARAFSTSTPTLEKSLPPRRVLLDSDLIEKFLHGSGPGGQKINKTSSAVQLKHIPTGIVVKYQDTRSRTVNRKMARKILQEKIEEAELGEDARTKVKQREKSKKKASADKKKRRKYRKLGEEQEAEDVEESEGVELESTGVEGTRAQIVGKPEGG